jgi:hypothetical protein
VYPAALLACARPQFAERVKAKSMVYRCGGVRVYQWAEA